MPNSLKDDVVLFIQTAEELGRWRQPEVWQALMFLTTEVGEAVDAYLRLPIAENAGWARAHPGAVDTRHLLTELADVVLMAYVTASEVDQDVDLALLVREKLQKRLLG